MSVIEVAKRTSRLRASRSENDPIATLAALSGIAFDAGFNPYQRICLNR
jgi:hypothetical protein